MGDMVDTRTLLGHVASLGAELTDLLAGYGHSSPKQRRVARDLREIANQCGPEPAIAAQCAPPPEPVVERFVPCVQCGEPVEESRKCVALPKCYACQPPEPLPVVKPAPVHPATPGTVFEWRVDAADEWHRETVTAVKIETDRHGYPEWWGDPAAWDKAARTGKLRIVAAPAVAHPERAEPTSAAEAYAIAAEAGLLRGGRGIVCGYCGSRAATCEGSCEGQWVPACDECCGHGGEEGRCYPIGSPEAYAAREKYERDIRQDAPPTAKQAVNYVRKADRVGVAASRDAGEWSVTYRCTAEKFAAEYERAARERDCLCDKHPTVLTTLHGCGKCGAPVCCPACCVETDAPPPEPAAQAEPVPLGTWCAQCGPDVRVDEDGCCVTCGGEAMGAGADEAIGLRNVRVTHEQETADLRVKLTAAEQALVDMRADMKAQRASLEEKLTAAREGQQRAERERATWFQWAATGLAKECGGGVYEATDADLREKVDARLARLARVEEAAKVILKRWDDCDIEGCDSDWTKLRAALDGGKAT
jgi:hypothetical protein